MTICPPNEFGGTSVSLFFARIVVEVSRSTQQLLAMVMTMYVSIWILLVVVVPSRAASLHSSMSDSSSSSYPRARRYANSLGRKKRSTIVDEDDDDFSSSAFNPIELWDDDEEEELMLAALERTGNYHHYDDDIYSYDEEDTNDGSEQEEEEVLTMDTSPFAKATTSRETKTEVTPARKPPPANDKQQTSARTHLDLKKQTSHKSRVVPPRETTPPPPPPSSSSTTTVFPKPERPRYNANNYQGIMPKTTSTTTTSSTATSSRTATTTTTTTTRPTVPVRPTMAGAATSRPKTKFGGATPKQSPSPRTGTVTPWVRKFVSSRPHDALLLVPREYLADGFNLVQLPLVIETLVGYPPDKNEFPVYKAALRKILSMEDEEEEGEEAAAGKEGGRDNAAIHERAAEMLYLLVHARYIASPRGLETVHRTLLHDDKATVFGRCPRVSCRGMPLLPYGSFELPEKTTHHHQPQRAQRYCCSCGEVFECWDSQCDGCGWGPSFCHLLLLSYGKQLVEHLQKHQIPPRNNNNNSGHHRLHPSTPSSSNNNNNMVTPSVFGFKVHPAALPSPR